MTRLFKIFYNTYLNRTSYDNSKPDDSGYLRVDEGYLLSLLCKYGGFKNISLSSKSKNLYKAYIDFIFNKTLNATDNSYSLSINSDYRFSESSFKGQMSFIHGMMSSIILAEFELNANMLLHLTDKRLVVTGEKSPDYFGTKYNGDVFLLEAKGSAKIVDGKTITNAEKQLNGITEIIDTNNGTIVNTYNDFLKYISTSNFNNSGNYFINLIDPRSTKGEHIAFSFDKAAYHHYRYIFDYIENNYDRSRKEELDSILYICVDLDEMTIGLDKGIFNLIRNYSNLDNQLFEKLRDIQKESYSWDSNPPEYLDHSNEYERNKNLEELDDENEIKEHRKGKSREDKNDDTEFLLIHEQYKKINNYIINRDGTCIRIM